MIYKPKGRKYFKVKFHFQGKVIHKATRAKTRKDARAIEVVLIVKGNAPRRVPPEGNESSRLLIIPSGQPGMELRSKNQAILRSHGSVQR